MTKKKYACDECGFSFPSELTDLIESKTQVFCESCGTPFSIKGIVFKPHSKVPTQYPAPYSPPRPYLRGSTRRPMTPDTHHSFSKNERKSLKNFITGLDSFSYIFIYIGAAIYFTIMAFELVMFILNIFSIFIPPFIQLNLLGIISKGLIGVAGILIATYDKKHISSKIEKGKYNEIALDSFCWGIMGCTLFGLGVPLLLKGIAIIIHEIFESQNLIHDFKDSLNYFSAKAGFVIIFLTAHVILSSNFPLPPLFFINDLKYFIIFVSIIAIVTIVTLTIDLNSRKDIREKDEFEMVDAVKFFILGILASICFAIGIFILLKGILLVLMVVFKPEKKKALIVVKEQEKKILEKQSPEVIAPIQAVQTKPIEKESIETISLSKKEKKVIEEHVKKTEKLKKELEKKPTPEKEYELKLHESLLPVADERDKELILEYFSKIFAVLSKDAKKQINNLKISKKEKKELLEEFAFLTKDEQAKYIDAIVNMYQEIPKKLIERIRKLPNVKPKHYDKIINQLKYLDQEEQLKFIQFLEENA